MSFVQGASCFRSWSYAELLDALVESLSTGDGLCLENPQYGTDSYSYGLEESGNWRAGSISQSETGSDRYALLESFDNIANSSKGTPGHLDFSPFGAPFHDPAPLVPWLDQDVMLAALTKEDRKALLQEYNAKRAKAGQPAVNVALDSKEFDKYVLGLMKGDRDSKVMEELYKKYQPFLAYYNKLSPGDQRAILAALKKGVPAPAPQPAPQPKPPVQSTGPGSTIQPHPDSMEGRKMQAEREARARQARAGQSLGEALWNDFIRVGIDAFGPNGWYYEVEPLLGLGGGGSLTNPLPGAGPVKLPQDRIRASRRSRTPRRVSPPQVAQVPAPGAAPATAGNPNAPRPVVKSPKGADPRVTQELPPGEVRTPEENADARQFFENHRDKARKWWEERTGEKWPKDSTHDHHPRELVKGGDPLFIEPGYGPSTTEHSREFFQEQGRIGGIRSGEVRKKK